jgi:hypothetical protein
MCLRHNVLQLVASQHCGFSTSPRAQRLTACRISALWLLHKFTCTTSYSLSHLSIVASPQVHVHNVLQLVASQHCGFFTQVHVCSQSPFDCCCSFRSGVARQSCIHRVGQNRKYTPYMTHDRTFGDSQNYTKDTEHTHHVSIYGSGQFCTYTACA